MIDYCRIARLSLTARLGRSRLDALNLRSGFRAGCFVSLHTTAGALRGCIGTIEPRHADLVDEIADNAIAAATRDPRFPPLQEDELPHVQLEVSVLAPPEPCQVGDLDPSKYGVIVTNGHRRGVLLPGLEGIRSVRQQLQIARKKGEIAGNEPIEIQRFEVQKYRESDAGPRDSSALLEPHD